MTAVASLTHVRVVIVHTLPTQLQLSAKLKILHRSVHCQKASQAIVLLHFLLTRNPINEMFIFSGKSRCCNGTFANILFTLLLAKNI